MRIVLLLAIVLAGCSKKKEEPKSHPAPAAAKT
jgi:PBP1b-binding outer membrane lipoprotein LpoB